MATRNILTKENALLLKHSREVTDFNERLHILLDDMKETLSSGEGVGLAGPQVGVLRRVVVVLETNVQEGQQEYFIELVNPEVISCEGSQSGLEGCLSLPGEYGIVTRPKKVRVRAQDRYGNFFEVEGEDLTARCFCHEIDHLDGLLYPVLAEKMLTKEELEKLLAEQKENEEKQEKEPGKGTKGEK